MGLKRKQIWVTLFCVYLAAVAFLCFMKTDDLPDMPMMIFGIPLDKIVHFFMFFPYPFIGYETFRPQTDKTWVHLLILAVIFATGIGLAIGTEEIQGLLGYRENDMKDAGADIYGLVWSTILTGIYIRMKQKKLT